MISLSDLVLIYTLYVIAIGLVYNLEITIFKALKKSITLPLTPFKYLISALTPLTPIQKEIRDEELTIKQLKKQKAEMKRLEELKQEREALFEELGKADFEARTGSHFMWCHQCGNAFSGEYCHCGDEQDYTVNPINSLKGQTTEEAGVTITAEDIAYYKALKHMESNRKE